MILAILLLLSGLTISGVAIYYSVMGLMAIFSAAAIPIAIMGVSLEIGKLVTASWVKAHWARLPVLMKWYAVTAVSILMVITSLGIFGFLSKAHSDQTLVSGDVQSKIAIYDEKIKTAKENIESDRKQLKQMDEAVDQIMARSDDAKGADKANAVRKSQQRDRGALAKDIEANQTTISQLNDESAPIRAENRKVEAEVGPIKYIAAFVYGANPDSSILEKAVTWVIILIVIVFDPLAVVMLLASQMTFAWIREEKSLVSEPVTEYPTIAELDRDVGEPPTPEEKRAIEEEPLPNLEPNSPVAEYKFEEEITGEEDFPIVKHYGHHISSIEFKDSDEQAIEPEVSTQETEPLIKPLEGEEDTEVQDEEASTVVVAPDVQPEIQTLGVDATERPGDYVTPPARVVREAAPARGRGIMHTHLEAQADNLPESAKAAHSGFGNEFPVNPDRGDVYLRTDYLPNRLFKFNGQKWIEVDSEQRDILAYDELYIQHLVQEIEAGRQDVDQLSDLERTQVAEFLNKNSG